MHMISTRTGVSCLVAAFALFGCAETSNLKTASPEIGPCEKLSIIQSGNEIKPTNGVFQIDRQPFVVRYKGSEKNPALSASPDRALTDALNRRGRQYLWASAGDYMAYAPNDLPLRTEFRLFTDEKSRDEFASLIGDNYSGLLKALVEKNPQLDTATFIPKAAGDFKAERSSDSYLYSITKLHGQPVSQTRYPKLYVTYFGTVDQYGPPQRGAYKYQSLLKVNWGVCLIAFNR